MKQNESEIILNHSIANASRVLKFLVPITLISFLYAFNIFSTYLYVSYFFIACGVILTGLITGIKYSKGAYLKLSQSGMEWKTPLSNKIKKAPWAEIKTIHIFSIEFCRNVSYQVLRFILDNNTPLFYPFLQTKIKKKYI